MPNKKLAIVSVTPGGNRLAQRVAGLKNSDCYTSERLCQDDFLPLTGGVMNGVKTLFSQYEALLFICATGIAVRAIAPLITDKLADPAILVMDESAKHIISLLSGHVGGANRLAIALAELIGAEPVITTATDINHVASLDMIAVQDNFNVVDYRASVKLINQMLVSGKRVGLYQQDAQVSDTRGFICIENSDSLPELDALVWVSMADKLPLMQIPVVQLVPKRIVVGIGCRRGTESEPIERLMLQALALNHLNPLALAAIGSVEIKKDEQGLISLARNLRIPFEIFTVEQLAVHEHRFPQSEFVKRTLGVASVSQPVAWIMSEGHLCGETLKQQGITITLGVISCCMS